MKRLKRVLLRVGHFQSALLLTLFYLIVWVPVGLITRLLVDWLHWRAPRKTNWWARDPRVNQPLHVRDPF